MRDDRNTRETLQRIERKLDWLRQEVRNNANNEAIGDYVMNQEILDKIRTNTTLSGSVNIAIREVIRLLKASASDPAKEAEAMELLEAMRADDAAILTENTPAFDPSANVPV